MGGHPLKYLEAGTSISSTRGNLQFYINHDSILNYNNELIENGDSLQVLESNTQGLIVIPKPQSKNQYYLISYGQCDFSKLCLNYSIIDMRENNGLGKVVLKKKHYLSFNLKEFLPKRYLELNMQMVKTGGLFYMNGNQITSFYF